VCCKIANCSKIPKKLSNVSNKRLYITQIRMKLFEVTQNWMKLFHFAQIWMELLPFAEVDLVRSNLPKFFQFMEHFDEVILVCPMRIGRRGQAPLDFKIFSKKGCFTVFEWKKSNFATFGPPPEKSFRRPWLAQTWLSLIKFTQMISILYKFEYALT